MTKLLRLAGRIDRINRFVGRATVWPLLGCVLVSVGNALSRKLFGVSSNAWIEIQWHLFALAFLGCAGYVLLVDEHVRVDLLSRRWPARLRAWIDVLVLAAVAVPVTLLFVVHDAPLFWRALRSGETHLDAGGLAVWPIHLAMIAGMALLGLQALSEIVRRVAFLRGLSGQATLGEADLPPIHARAGPR